MGSGRVGYPGRTVAEVQTAFELVRGAAAAVLRQAPEAIDPRVDLFEQGMSSIVAIELVRRLEKRLGRALPPTLVLDHPTVERLARALDRPAPAPGVAPSRPASAAEVAIVGFGVRLPGSSSVEAFWKARLAGEGWIRLPPPSRGAPVDRAAGWLDDVAAFDNDRFGITDREAAALDPLHRLVLEASADALDAGGLHPVRGRTGVWLGLPDGSGRERWSDAYGGTGSESSFAAGRVAWSLDLGGPAIAVNTACSASLVAIHQAVSALRAGEVDAALAGGGSLLDGPGFAVLDALGALSGDGECRAFAEGASGYGRGEGVVMLALARADLAAARGLGVVARIRGSAVNHGGRTSGVTVPEAAAQAAVVRAAAAAAEADVDLVVAHGTGTPLGDPIELRGLNAALGATRPRFLVSTKTAIGHLEQAAGALGVLEGALALRDQVVPPHRHGGSAPGFDLPGVATPAALRHVGVSAFGISGTNAHLVLGAAGPVTLLPPSTRPAIVCLDSRDAAPFAAALPTLPWPDAAAATRQRRTGRDRVAVVAGSGIETILGTQLAVTALALGLSELWRAFGLRVHGVVGHSFGEIAAAAFCGVFSPEEAIRLAAARGRRMAALPVGGQMAVVAAGAEVVGPLLGERCWIAGYHGPAETVIAGEIPTDALAGFDVRTIAVDNAYHCPRVAPAAEAFARDLASFLLRALDAPRLGLDRRAGRGAVARGRVLARAPGLAGAARRCAGRGPRGGDRRAAGGRRARGGAADRHPPARRDPDRGALAAGFARQPQGTREHFDTLDPARQSYLSVRAHSRRSQRKQATKASKTPETHFCPTNRLPGVSGDTLSASGDIGESHVAWLRMWRHRLRRGSQGGHRPTRITPPPCELIPELVRWRHGH